MTTQISLSLVCLPWKSQKNNTLVIKHIFLCCLLLSLYNVSYGQNNEQKELKALQSEINVLDKKISKNEKKISAEKTDLQSIEKNLTNTQADIRNLSDKIIAIEETVVDLTATVDSQKKQVNSQISQLENIIVKQYKDKDAGLMRMLLNQKDPEKIDRMQQYYQHYSKSQAKLIDQYRAQIAEYLTTKETLSLEQESLDKAKKEQDKLITQLEDQQSQRQKNIAALDNQISKDANALNRLQVDQQRLKKLIKELQLKAKQREIAEKKAALARAKELARIKAEQEKARQQQAQQNASKNPSSTEQTQSVGQLPKDPPPTDSSNIIVEADKPKKEPKTSRQGLGKLKGQLPYPIKGRLLAKYGSAKSGSGLTWNGLLIEGKLGSNVKAVADGEIVYADWFRGYGQMVVVDHGKGYMTLYSHNSEMTKAVGSHVKQNDVIAKIGDTGGLKAPGLYFELRYNGQAVNPISWLR